jgi:HK97 family phage major capsid protein
MEKEQLVSEFKGVVEAGLKPVIDSVNELKSKVETLEKAPALQAPAIISSAKHLGYDLRKQGKVLREKMVGKAGFEALNSEENIDKLSKFFIDVIRGKASMQVGTDSEGGYTVPIEYQSDLIQLARDQFFALRECDVLNMSHSQLYVPKEATLASVAWTNEETAATQGEPTFGQLALTAKKLDGLAIVSNELLQDSVVDIVSLLAEQFSYAINQELDKQALQGTGVPCSGLMKGVVTSNSVTMATGSAHFSMITADHISNVIALLSTGYLANAKFVFGRNAAHYIRSLKDSQGRPIYAFPSAAVPGTIYGYPYIMSDQAINTSAVSTVEVLFGNLKAFKIGRRVGAMTLEVDPYGKFAENQTRFRVVTRWALGVGNEKAFSVLKTAAS